MVTARAVARRAPAGDSPLHMEMILEATRRVYGLDFLDDFSFSFLFLRRWQDWWLHWFHFLRSLCCKGPTANFRVILTRRQDGPWSVPIAKNRQIIHIYNTCMLGCVYIYYCGGTAEPVAHNNPNPANWMTSRSSLFFSVVFPPRHRFVFSSSDLTLYGVHFVLREENNPE